MSKFSKLLYRIDTFCKLASSPLDKAIINSKTAIQAELSGGIGALNRLVSTNKEAAKSSAIKVVEDTFGKLNSSLHQLPTSQSTPEMVKPIVETMLNDIGQASFYTNVSNTGTGYDPLTHVGGAKSPGAYLKRIHTHISRLNSYLSNFPTNPGNSPQKLTNIA